MKRRSIPFLKSWAILIKPLPPEEQCFFWELFMDYETGVDSRCEIPSVKPIWEFVKSQLDGMLEQPEPVQNIREKQPF